MNDKYYVYTLLDPRKFNAPFYVGKGCGDRYNQHLDGRCDGENKFKDKVIKAIRKAGVEPTVKLLSENMNEDTAYDLETWYIQLWGRRNIDPGGILTNVSLDKKPPSRKGAKLTEEQKERSKGRTPWNKGLTKETDKRVKRNGETTSHSLKGNIPWNKGLDGSDLRIAKLVKKLVVFKKGNVPWNRGTRGLMKANSGSWGQKPAWNKMSLTQEFIDMVLNDTRPQVEIAKDLRISQSLVSAIKRGVRKADVA